MINISVLMNEENLVYRVMQKSKKIPEKQKQINVEL